MRLRVSWLLAAALLVLAMPASAQTFVFHLSGDQEVPPVPSVATGGCHGVLDQPAATFSVICVHNVIGATVMHIHRGAAGVNGDIVFDLGDPASPVTATWTSMTPADIADLLAGNLYINIHTSGRPAGEIRGQILPRTVDLVSFTAEGNQVVPPNSSDATANCTADLDAGATAIAVNCTHDLAAPVAAHIHYAPVLQNGPIVFTFPTPTSPLSANVPLTPELVAAFAAIHLYLDIHTAGGGEDDAVTEEIRGQIGTPPAGAGTGTIRIMKTTNPAGGTGFTFTENITLAGAFALDHGGTQTFSGVPLGTYTVSENDPSSSPGGYTLADITCDDADSTGDAFTREATIRLQEGEVVTCTFRNFESAPTDQLFVFHLSGDQEVPPVPTNKRGGCMGRFDAAASELSLVCTHNVDDATVMHIHRGAPGVNGPIVFDLGSPVSPVVATWSGMTPADEADLLAGDLYVNIHTAGRPGGEIRGQILERTVDVVNFTANASQAVPPGTTPATATCSADLDAPATSISINCTHDFPSPDVAHVHTAPFGENGPVIFTFPSAASPLAAGVPLTPRLVADYAAGFLYLDIHGVEGGEETSAADQIRGQIGPLPVVFATGTIRIVKSTTPAGGTGFNFTDNVPGSPGTFTLDDGGTQTFTGVLAGTYTFTELAPAGYSVTDVVCSDDNSVGNPFARTATVNLQGAETVTCTFRNLRNAASPSSLFVFNLSGDQEVPPVPTTERGGCFGQFDATASSLTMICTHNVADATVMHIHTGARGTNGAIAFDMGDPSSPVEATWTGMTAADISNLFAGNLYVNIHTSGRPGGAIRGQIEQRTVDNFFFNANAAQEVPPTDTTATGQCQADLSDNAQSLFVQCQHNVDQVTDIHLHVAPAGSDGPIIFHFPNVNPFSGNVPLTPRLVADFAAGFLYVNIHSTDFEMGEIRGQLIASAPALAGAGDVPTLSEWMALLFALSLLGFGWWRLR